MSNAENKPKFIVSDAQRAPTTYIAGEHDLGTVTLLGKEHGIVRATPLVDGLGEQLELDDGTIITLGNGSMSFNPKGYLD